MRPLRQVRAWDARRGGGVAVVAAALALSGCAASAPAPVLQSIECDYGGATTAGTDISRGIAVYAVYDNGSRSQIQDGYEVSGNTKLKAGKKSTVSVSYQGLSGKVSVKCTTLTKAQYKKSCAKKSPDKFAAWAIEHPKKAIGKRIEMRGTIVSIDGYSCLLPVSLGNDLYETRMLGKLNELWNLGTTGAAGIDTDAVIEGIASLRLAYPILEWPDGELHDWQTIRAWGEVDRMEEVYNDAYGLTYDLPVVEVKYGELAPKK